MKDQIPTHIQHLTLTDTSSASLFPVINNGLHTNGQWNRKAYIRQLVAKVKTSLLEC